MILQSVRRFNAMIEAGEDTDFGRFSGDDEVPNKIMRAPFYAVQMFPMTRKNMGGVAIDRQARALDQNGRPIPGLYAVGELTGSVGINGKHGLDGMFLGPAILTGRLAGQSIASTYAAGPEKTSVEKLSVSPNGGDWQAALRATDLESLLEESRDGYRHFEASHRLVVERDYECTRCHSQQLPFSPHKNRESMLAQTRVCTDCH